MGVCGYCVLIPKEGKVQEGNMQFWALELHIGHLHSPPGLKHRPSLWAFYFDVSVKANI